MIILLGGVTSSGKTNLAQELMEQQNIPYISLELVKAGLIPEQNGTDELLTESHEKITNKIWPFIDNVIRLTVERKQHVILEGSYLTPENIKSLPQKYTKYIIPVFLLFSKRYIQKQYNTGVYIGNSLTDNMNLSNKNSGDEKIVIEFHQALKKRCKTENIKYFEIQGEYRDETTDALKWLKLEIEKKRQIEKYFM